MNHSRTRLFVDRAFQGRLLARLAAYWVIYHIVLWHLMFLCSLFFDVIGSGPSNRSSGLLARYGEFSVDHAGVIVCFFVTLPLIGRDMLKFSHRLAGPLVRFRETMKQMTRGEPVSEITLRPNDLPTDFLAIFNRLLTVWNSRVPSREPKPADEQLELVETA